MIYYSSTHEVNKVSISYVYCMQIVCESGDILMNEKFFDLKKDKQDRMINAALKIFALNGYAHASTDDIVREAGISKGLLFHYFISKLGLYSFIYDYSVRYMILELSTGVSRKETDYFEILRQINTAQLQVMKNYPYMVQFLNKSKDENVSEALLETEDKRNVLPGQYVEFMQGVQMDLFREDIDTEKLSSMIEYSLNGLMMDCFREDSFQPELYHQDALQYLDLFQKMSYK